MGEDWQALGELPIVGDVRCAGLMAAIELVRDRTTKASFPDGLRVPWRIRSAALRRGVIVRASADTVVVCPPLIITPAQIDLIAQVLRESIAEVSAELAATAELEPPAAMPASIAPITLPLPGIA